jgi:hypothetical protein
MGSEKNENLGFALGHPIWSTDPERRYCSQENQGVELWTRLWSPPRRILGLSKYTDFVSASKFTGSM